MIDTLTPLSSQSLEETIVIPVQHEELHVNKKLTDTGKGLRILKSVEEETCVINELLMHDEITINHVSVDKILPLENPPVARYDGNTLIVPVLEEVLVVEKRLRLKEEIHIQKRQREEHHEETIIVKSENVTVEHFDKEPQLKLLRSNNRVDLYMNDTN